MNQPLPTKPPLRTPAAIFPMIVLFIFFVYGLTLDGAADGIVYYVTPDFDKIKNFNVWTTAASQVSLKRTR
jgi:SNF family Na+-dependent transporter